MKKPRKAYDHQTLHEERKYGFFWYDWLWRIVRPLLVVVTAGCLVAGIGLTGWRYVDESLLMPVDTQDTTPIEFTVSSGSSLTRVTNDLKEQNLVRNKGVIKYWMDFQGLGQKVQAGVYTLNRAMTLNQIIAQLTQGDGKPITRKITVIPGWTITEIADRLVQDGAIASTNAFLEACRTGESFSDYYYIADVLQTPKVNQRHYVLEGYLTPDTYEVYTNATVTDIIKKLLSQTEVVYTQAFHERADALHMTMDQVLTLASMIEKEAKTDDFAKVSAVFHNRLALNMALGSDVTVQYSTGSDKMALTDAELSVISAYNTYKNTGLPIGPICSPSQAAIQAALYPDEQFIHEQYLYFCSTEPGNAALFFSKTLEEHEAATAKYRPLWIQYDQNRGAE